MKKLILFTLLLINSYSYSQELMNFYIEPNGANSITLQTLYYNNTFSYFGNYSVSFNANEITVTFCYVNTAGQSETYDYQSNTINLPTGYTTYTLTIEVYGDNDGSLPCSLDNLEDTGTITFNYPYNPTATTYIPDNGFEDYMEDLGFGDDIVNNDLVFTHKIVNMTNLFLNNYFENSITNMEGLQDFVSLRDLRCGGSQHTISELDVSNNLNLEWLWCYSNPISELDVSNNTNLKWLWAWDMNLTNLDVTFNLNLENLIIYNNSISSINLSQNFNLKKLQIASNQISNLNLNNNILLEFLSCSSNLLISLDITNNANIKELYIENNSLSIIDLTNNNLLEILALSNNFFSDINISNLTNLRLFSCWNNQLTTLDLSANILIEEVWVPLNNLNTFNLKNGYNSNIAIMISADNDNLYCIEVDNPEEAPYSGWSVDSQVVFSEDCSLGIAEQTLQEELQFYPNPVKNTLQISVENNITIKSIQVFDVLGKKVLATKNTKQIDVSALAAGLLFVKVATDKGVVIKKVIKE